MRKKQLKFGKPEKGFKSKFEASVAEWFEQNNLLYEYEPCHLKYTVPSVERKRSEEHTSELQSH